MCILVWEADDYMFFLTYFTRIDFFSAWLICGHHQFAASWQVKCDLCYCGQNGWQNFWAPLHILECYLNFSLGKARVLNKMASQVFEICIEVMWGQLEEGLHIRYHDYHRGSLLC